MENYGSSTTPAFEVPSAGPDKPEDKDGRKSAKKSSSPEATVNTRKQQAEHDIARSLDRLFENSTKPKGEADTKPDKPAVGEQSSSKEKEAVSEPAHVPEQLSPDETLHVQRVIAQEHLNAIEQTDPDTQAELKPAAEFLQLVSDGVDTETAFSEVAEELDLEPGEDSDEVADESTESLEAAGPAEEEISWQPEETIVPPTAGAGGGGNRGGGGRGRGPAGAAGGNPPPPSSPAPSSPSPPQSGNTVSVSQPNMLPAAANTYYYQRARQSGGNTLITGLGGYLAGRRRGRIKTEKRLQPVQRKLEQQVVRLEQNITSKEQRLVTSKPKVVEARPEMPVVPVERAQPGRPESRLGLEKPKRAERLGHVAIVAETPPGKRAESIRYERPNNIRQAFRPEAVKTMHRNELLELSEKITVEGASLRRIYESRLIGEKQLRHLVGEYLAGKDIRRDLRREMIEREIDFERDPQLRDRVRSRLAATNGSGSGLKELLARAEGMSEEEKQQAARQASDERYEKAQQQKASRRRKTADTAMITAIVALAVVVIALVVGR